MEPASARRCPDGSRVKHLNGDTLDNRIENLFLAPRRAVLFRRLNGGSVSARACGDEYLIHPEKTGPRSTLLLAALLRPQVHRLAVPGLRRYPKRIDADRWRM